MNDTNNCREINKQSIIHVSSIIQKILFYFQYLNTYLFIFALRNLHKGNQEIPDIVFEIERSIETFVDNHLKDVLKCTLKTVEKFLLFYLI